MSAQTNRLKEFLLISTSMQAQSTTQKESKGLHIFVNMQFVHSQQKGLQQGWKNGNIKVHTLIQTLPNAKSKTNPT